MGTRQSKPDIEAENGREIQEMEMEQVEMNKEVQPKLQIINIWGVMAHNLWGLLELFEELYRGIFWVAFWENDDEMIKSGQDLEAKSYSE